MKSKKIIFYTDCAVFGGSEKHIFEILSNSSFNCLFDAKLVFRKSRKYLGGWKNSFAQVSPEKAAGVYLADINSAHLWLDENITSPFARSALKKAASLFFLLFLPLIFVYDFLALFFIFRSLNPDIIHINNGGYPGAAGCLAAIFAAKACGCKRVVLSVNNTARRRGIVLGALLDCCVKRCVSLAVTGSCACADALSARRGFERGKIRNIYHGIKGFPVKAEAQKSERHIVMAASFEERKGHKFALAALKQLYSDHPGYRGIKLLLLGEGELFGEIKSLVSQNGLRENVKFLGHVSSPENLIASSLFLLAPSLGYEDLPYSVLEAMSLGVPVIGTRVAGIPEEVEDGVSGLLVAAGDTQALVSAMHFLLSREDDRERMGSAAGKRFSERFSAQRMAQDYISLYNNLC